MNGFPFLLVSLLITGFCILVCVVYISNKFKEASCSSRLLDADFPSDIKPPDKKTLKKYADIYSRPSSDARLAMGMFYSQDKLEALKPTADPNEFPKGRYTV